MNTRALAAIAAGAAAGAILARLQPKPVMQPATLTAYRRSGFDPDQAYNLTCIHIEGSYLQGRK